MYGPLTSLLSTYCTGVPAGLDLFDREQLALGGGHKGRRGQTAGKEGELRWEETASASRGTVAMEMREVLAPAPADESIEMGQRAGARVAGDAGELQERLLTHTWDGTARGGAASRPAPTEGDVQHVQPPCTVRVITALDRGIGQYVVKEGVSWLKLARALQQQAIASHPPVLRVQTRVRHVDSCVMGQRIRLGVHPLCIVIVLAPRRSARRRPACVQRLCARTYPVCTFPAPHVSLTLRATVQLHALRA